MWQLFLEQLMREVQKQAAKQAAREAGKGIASLLIGAPNKPEAYADRINKEFNLRSYAKAWALYDSDRAYWEKLYGDDPLTSPRHPASPPKSLVPRQPGASAPVYNPLNPATRDANALGPFGTGGQFVPGSATSSRQLYETQQTISPPEAIDESEFVRRLARVGNIANATPFDSGAPPVPFMLPNPILSPDRPATIEERSRISLPPSAASPSTASPDDLETFRRQWLKTYL
jgi:hypothetical protein